MKNFSLIAILIFSSLFVFAFDNVYGHGLGSETFPPVELDGKLVTLEVSSSQSDPDTNDDQQISISLIDFDSKITLRDVTFLIKSERGEKFLFEQEFKADNGFIVFNFISEETDSIILEEDNNAGGLFSSLLGLESRMVHVKGPSLSEGGLYKFDISILTADGYTKKLEEPFVFNSGISIAQTTKHDFIDPNFGEQNIQVITYYDEISNFEYNSNSKEVSYSMPFEWSESNINQTSVVHEEIVIPKTFGDLLVSGFTMYINDVKLAEDVVTIDDFFADERIVHFIIYQKELFHVLHNTSNQNGMNFVIKPDRDDIHLSSVTENGQFRILVSWEPENLKSNSNAKIIFDVTDTFLKNRPVATDYELSVTQNDRIIFEQSGISSDSKDKHNVVEFMIPEDITGVVHLNFNNLDHNNLAKTTVPIVVNPITNQNDEVTIPDWVRNIAKWWSLTMISDEDFANSLEYLIQNDIIQVPENQPSEGAPESELPSWLRQNAGWWSQELLSDDEFFKSIQWLINNEFIRV